MGRSVLHRLHCGEGCVRPGRGEADNECLQEDIAHPVLPGDFSAQEPRTIAEDVERNVRSERTRDHLSTQLQVPAFDGMS